LFALASEDDGSIFTATDPVHRPLLHRPISAQSTHDLTARHSSAAPRRSRCHGEEKAAFATDTLERGVDHRLFGLAAALLRHRHRRNLQRVHPRQPADAFLIERDGRAIGRGEIVLAPQFGAAIEQLAATEAEIER
jgi:hypothetical protein